MSSQKWRNFKTIVMYQLDILSLNIHSQLVKNKFILKSDAAMAYQVHVMLFHGSFGFW